MASRNRPRGGMKDEERDMWNQILADIKRAKAINLRCAETSKLIVALESAMSKCMYKTPLKPTIGLCFLCIAGTFLRCGGDLRLQQTLCPFPQKRRKYRLWVLVDLTSLSKRLLSEKSMD